MTEMKFVMYHASPLPNFGSIMRYGLIPSLPQHQDSPFAPRVPVVYMSDSIETVKDYAEQAYEAEGIQETKWAVFEIAYEEFPEEPQPDLLWGLPGTYYVTLHIQPDHIEPAGIYDISRKVFSGPYISPEEKYQLVRRTKRGSLVVIEREGSKATIDVTNYEDMLDISNLLNASGIKWHTESIEGGRRVEFNFSDLEYVMSDLGEELMLP